MIEMVKIITNEYDQGCTEGVFYQREEDTTNKNSKKIFKKRSGIDMMKHSFPNRVMNIWNDLPEWTVSAENVIKFESHLDSVWKEQEQKYDYEDSITTTHSQNGNQTSELESQA